MVLNAFLLYINNYFFIYSNTQMDLVKVVNTNYRRLQTEFSFDRL